MAELVFTSPWYLWLLAFIPAEVVLHFASLWYVRRKAIRFANFTAIEKATGGQVLPTNVGALAVRIVIILILVLAVSGATFIYVGPASDFDYVIAVDTSASMLADDIAPNRLEAAKSSALQFIDQLPVGTRVGVVEFSGITQVLLRLTDDRAAVRDSISNINLMEGVGGTAIGEAIVTSSNALVASDRAKAVILLTDGESNVGILPEDATKYALANNVIVHTIGVGTPQGGKFAGIDIVSKLDEPTLQSIASTTGGRYARADSPDALKQAYSNIAIRGQRKIAISLPPYLLIVLFALLFLDWGLTSIRYRPISL